MSLPLSAEQVHALPLGEVFMPVGESLITGLTFFSLFSLADIYLVNFNSIYTLVYFMVELEMDDFAEILKWFNFKYDEVEDKGMGEQSRKTFWKLHFLLEDKMIELRNLAGDDEPKKEN